MLPEITFRRLTDDDLALMHRWLNNPEVARWYGLGFENDTSPTLEDVEAYYSKRMLDQEPVRCCIIEADSRPAGFIQTYRLGDYPQYAKDIAYDDDAWGIDLFVGEDDVRGGGFGTRVIERFLEEEVWPRPGVTAAILAPNPDNARGIRCYEKAGFAHVKTVFIELEKNEEYVMARQKMDAD
ncbi:MAG: GNAT family N-acetyltransferase [Chloroflexota bacterium]